MNYQLEVHCSIKQDSTEPCNSMTIIENFNIQLTTDRRLIQECSVAITHNSHDNTSDYRNLFIT